MKTPSGNRNIFFLHFNCTLCVRAYIGRYAPVWELPNEAKGGRQQSDGSSQCPFRRI